MGVVIKLLEITHDQWLFCNVIVHDGLVSMIATWHKEEIQREIKKQKSLGVQDLQNEDM
jgi:hypothetical protein